MKHLKCLLKLLPAGRNVRGGTGQFNDHWSGNSRLTPASRQIGPMKGVNLTRDTAKKFHPTPGIEGKKCLTPDIQNLSQHLTPNFKCTALKEWLHQVDTWHCDFQVDTRHCKIFYLDTRYLSTPGAPFKLSRGNKIRTTAAIAACKWLSRSQGKKYLPHTYSVNSHLTAACRRQSHGV